MFTANEILNIVNVLIQEMHQPIISIMLSYSITIFYLLICHVHLSFLRYISDIWLNHLFWQQIAELHITAGGHVIVMQCESNP